MATINELATLSVPTGSENVVIQNGNGNYKMSFKPAIGWAGNAETAVGDSTSDVINKMLNATRTQYGDLQTYHVMAYSSVPNWPNGATMSVDVVKAGNYIVWFGIMFSEHAGVQAFERWDTIGGAAGTLKVSELGNGLA